jgi:hypothetical protein
VAEVVPNGKALARAREIARLFLTKPDVARRNTRIHFVQPIKERLIREVGYGLALEGASAAALVKSFRSCRRAKDCGSEPRRRPRAVFR